MVRCRCWRREVQTAAGGSSREPAVLCCCCMEEQVVASLLQRARPNLITITASFKEPFQNQTNTALKASILAQGGPTNNTAVSG